MSDKAPGKNTGNPPPPSNNNGDICKTLGKFTNSPRVEGVCRNLTGTSKEVTETENTVCITEHGWDGKTETNCYTKKESS